jgi:hypothetical protein
VARAMSICWIGVGAIANTVSKPALHIEHEAIPPWDARVARLLARARYRQRCPAVLIMPI